MSNAIAIIPPPVTDAELVTAQQHEPKHTADDLNQADRKAYTKARAAMYAAGNRAWARWGRTPTMLEVRAEVLGGQGKSNAEVRGIVRGLEASDKSQASTK
jgi:hypothetical protein